MSAAEMLAGAAPGRTPDWYSLEGKTVWQTVRRLQARIVKAVAEGRWNKVKALVYLLTHSFGGRALAILRVVSNSGAKTPGVDGVLWNTPEAKSAAFGTLRRHGYQPQPLRRVYIPKSNGKRARSRDSDLSFILHLFATELGIERRNVRPFRGPCLAHEAERRVQERRVGLRKRAMISGVNWIHQGPWDVDWMPSRRPDWHQSAIVDTSH